MKTKKFPYAEFQNLPVWNLVDSSVERLIANDDLILQTERSYVVDLIVKELHKSGMLRKKAVGPHPKNQ